jgi:hypothetical protein
MKIEGKNIQYHYDLCEEFMRKSEFELEKYFQETYKTTDVKTVFEVSRDVEYSDSGDSIIEELLSIEYVISRCSINLYVDGKMDSTIFASFDEIRRETKSVEIVQKITMNFAVADFLNKHNIMTYEHS